MSTSCDILGWSTVLGWNMVVGWNTVIGLGARFNRVGCLSGDWFMFGSCFGVNPCVMDIVIFRTIFFELLVFFTFTLLTLHSVY